MRSVKAYTVATCWLNGAFVEDVRPPVQKKALSVSGRILGRSTEEGESPVGESNQDCTE